MPRRGNPFVEIDKKEYCPVRGYPIQKKPPSTTINPPLTTINPPSTTINPPSATSKPQAKKAQ